MTLKYSLFSNEDDHNDALLHTKQTNTAHIPQKHCIYLIEFANVNFQAFFFFDKLVENVIDNLQPFIDAEQLERIEKIRIVLELKLHLLSSMEILYALYLVLVNAFGKR